MVLRFHASYSHGAGGDGLVRVWNSKSLKALGKPLRGHQRGVRSVLFTSDGNRLISAGEEGTVRV